MAKPRTLRNVAKKGFSTILERCKDDDTYRARMTEQGLNDDDIRRRVEKKHRLIVYANAIEKQWWGKHFLPKETWWT